MNRFSRFACAAAVLLLLGTAAAFAQQQPFTSGLLGPSKVIFTPRGNLLVAESGSGPNSGRISVVDRTNGQARVLVSGLPSAIDTEKEPSGPSGLVLRGNTIYLTIGGGDQTLAGPVPGSETPNPNPSSPLLSSVLALDLGAPIEDMTGALSVSPSDQATVAGGTPVTLQSGSSSATLRLVANLPNYRSEPRPDFAQNVRGSDPWGLAMIGNTLYVAEAGWNAIESVDPATGTVATVATFPPIKNPTPAGPPFLDAVPDSIRADGNRLIVTLLTGFPFVSGLSSVVSVDPYSGAVTPLVTGLTTAIDAVPLNGASGRSYLITEISTNLSQGAPGTILLQGPQGMPKTIVDSVAFPTNLAVDQRTGDVYATQIFPGTLAHFTLASSLPAALPSAIIPVVGSVSGAFGSRFETSLQLSNGQSYPVSGVLNLHSANGALAQVPYQLQAFETRAYPNLFAAAGISGVTSLDIDAGVGPAPRAVARIYDTSRNSAATGAVIVQVSPADALYGGDRAVLVATSDASNSRTNIGVRALADGAVVKFTLFRDGEAFATTTRTYGPDGLQQLSGDELFSTPLQANDSILVEVQSGAAIPYLSVVNNTTQEMSFERGIRMQ